MTVEPVETLHFTAADGSFPPQHIDFKSVIMPNPFLSGIFGRSPVDPLKEHMAKAAEAARQLVVFID